MWSRSSYKGRAVWGAGVPTDERAVCGVGVPTKEEPCVACRSSYG
ncbi:MAG TPA: hypothetical protein PKK05_15295 [Leptospiraceae bacterium]|nr:hypothetical protein [Leptospiraceae bacterium]